MNWHPRPLPNANNESLREIREATHTRLRQELEADKTPETANRNILRRMKPHWAAM